jgi:2-oxoglutarate ferredoxin oxidoreductase subunit alpha
MEKKVNRFTWKIAGEAGFGVNSSGLLFSKYCMRSGLNAFEYSEYPSLVRGGHQSSQVTVDTKDVTSEHFIVDLLVALNKESVSLHVSELSEHAVIVYDSAQFTLSSPQEIVGKNNGVSLIGVPFTQLAIEAANLSLLRNTVAIGASLAVLQAPLDELFNLIAQEFGKKDQGTIDMNNHAIQLGYEYVLQHYAGVVENFPYKIEPKKLARPQMLISGNEAVGVGAIKGGVEFYSGYPMTPSSTLMAYMAAKQYDFGFVVKHAEDEIAVVTMAIGASFAGARSMCATSGGGFALMGEGIGLAAITETPLVIVNVQRPGPATGLPTWTDQGDLRFVMHAAQGEFFRMIIAPGDMQECYIGIQQALNFAERYQIPVIVLTDKWLAESHASVAVFDEKGLPVKRGKLALNDKQMSEMQVQYQFKEFGRYTMSNDGVSPRTVPGVAQGVFLANSDEHDEVGFTSEEAEMRIMQVDKRMMKLHPALAEMPNPLIYGNEHSSTLLVGWGSVKGPVLEALKLVQEEHDTSVAFMHMMYMWPFPTDFVKTMLVRYRKIILVENNSFGQLGQLIEQMTGTHIHDKWLKYDGRPFWPEELRDKIAVELQLKEEK